MLALDRYLGNLSVQLESPGELVKTQIADSPPGVSDSVDWENFAFLTNSTVGLTLGGSGSSTWRTNSTELSLHVRVTLQFIKTPKLYPRPHPSEFLEVGPRYECF